jgi:hypothetical protein
LENEEDLLGYKVMQIEVSNLCSLTCSYCPHPSQARPKGNMTFDTFKKCIELVQQSEDPRIGGKQFVWLNHFGEPLLNPELSDFIKHAVARNIEVSFSSNGLDVDRQMFSRELWRSLADAGLRYVIVSAHERSAASLRKHVGDIIEIVETWQPKRSQLHDWAGQVDLGKLVPPMSPPVNSPCDYETYLGPSASERRMVWMDAPGQRKANDLPETCGPAEMSASGPAARNDVGRNAEWSQPAQRIRYASKA